jgi:epoxyqueuosine reductase
MVAVDPILDLHQDPSRDPHQLAARVKAKAREIGFDLCGIASAEPSAHRDYLRQWLDAGHAGEMRYLHDRFDERTDVGRILPGARSVICVALNYHVPLEPPPPEQASPVRVARYALGVDYHVHLKDKLYALADWLRQAVPGVQTRSSVDTAPLLERELAARAGLGWLAKNTMLVNERIGSWTFLGEVVTTLELPVDAPAKDRCGTCRRCLDACPTRAITAPYELDATRCISYLTIEHRGEIEPELAEKLGGWVAGCDICQQVCPWNGRAPIALLDELQPRHPSGTIDADAIEAWSQEDYFAATRRSATRRIKLPQFKRNAALAKRDVVKVV